MLTGVGKRYDIVSCFAALTTVVAVDPNPLAPAQYAAHVRASAPPIDDPEYVPELARLCEAHGVGAVLPLTDLDIEKLAQAREQGVLPALVPSSEVARATYDKYEAHLLLEQPRPALAAHGAPARADLDALDYPVMVKPRRGSGARSIHLAHDPSQARFFVEYVHEPTMVQRAMGGPELSIDCLGDQRRALPERDPAHDARVARGRVDQGHRDRRSRAGRVGAHGDGGAAGARSRHDPGVPRPAARRAHHRRQHALRRRLPGARPGGSPGSLLPRADRAGWRPASRWRPHVGEYRADVTFTRYYWQLELDERLRPTGKDILPGGSPPPRCKNGER